MNQDADEATTFRFREGNGGDWRGGRGRRRGKEKRMSGFVRRGKSRLKYRRGEARRVCALGGGEAGRAEGGVEFGERKSGRGEEVLQRAD